MALTARIEPVQIIDRTAIQLSAHVRYYDLVSKNCSLFYWLSDASGARLGEGFQFDIPGESLHGWGTDDNIIMEILAAHKNFTIINIIGDGPIDLN